jgi:dolichyl-phosphate-mannose-protein mannosyltransferase
VDVRATMANTSSKRAFEKSRSPEPPVRNGSTPKQNNKKSYASDGVKDNDIFLLPAFDYQVMGAMTVLAAVVRLFRIYQPTSVVFDEVQYVRTFSAHGCR